MRNHTNLRNSSLMNGAMLATCLLVGFPTAVASSSDFDDLEVRVWNSEDMELPALENTVARLIQKEPASSHAHYLMSRIYLRKFSTSPGELLLLKQASELAEQAVELDARSDEGFIALADILDVMGHSAKGVSLLGQAEKIVADTSWRVPFTKARLQVDSLGVEESLGLLAKALKQPGVKRSIVVPYVIAILQTNYQDQDLVDKLAIWNARHPHGLFVQTLAATYGELGNYQKAHDFYQVVQKDFPEIKEAKINDAIILYKHLKNPDKAIEIFEKTLKSKIAEFEPQHLTTIYLHMASAYLRKKELSKAHDINLTAMKKAPAGMAALEFIAKSYNEEKQHRPLVTLLNVITQEIVGSGTIYALMGETLSEHLKDHRKALEAYQKAIVLEPNRSDVYTGYGLTFYRMKRFQEALNQFAQAVRVDPEDATAKYNQACTLSLLNRGDEALSTLQEAILLDPRLQESAKKDQDFAGMQKLPRFRQLVFDEPVFVRDSSPEPEDSTLGH